MTVEAEKSLESAFAGVVDNYRGADVDIGQFVAKVELQVAVLDLLPNLRLDPNKPAPKITGAQLRGPHELHVLWG